jgi:plasmid maintenance system antidote protein VapI
MDKVAAALKATNYSALARQVGTTPSFISLLFGGRRGASMGTTGKLAKALGMSMDDLHRHLTRVQGRREKADVAA